MSLPQEFMIEDQETDIPDQQDKQDAPPWYKSLPQAN